MAKDIEREQAKDIAAKINKTRDKGSKVTIKEVMDMDERQIDFLLGRDMNQGGLATKNYVNPVTIVDNRRKKL